MWSHCSERDCNVVTSNVTEIAISVASDQGVNYFISSREVLGSTPPVDSQQSRVDGDNARNRPTRTDLKKLTSTEIKQKIKSENPMRLSVCYLTSSLNW